MPIQITHPKIVIPECLNQGLSTFSKMLFLNSGYRFKSLTKRIARLAKERKSEIARLDPNIGTLISDILNFRHKWLAAT